MNDHLIPYLLLALATVGSIYLTVYTLKMAWAFMGVCWKGLKWGFSLLRRNSWTWEKLYLSANKRADEYQKMFEQATKAAKRPKHDDSVDALAYACHVTTALKLRAAEARIKELEARRNPHQPKGTLLLETMTEVGGLITRPSGAEHTTVTVRSVYVKSPMIEIPAGEEFAPPIFKVEVGGPVPYRPPVIDDK